MVWMKHEKPQQVIESIIFSRYVIWKNLGINLFLPNMHSVRLIFWNNLLSWLCCLYHRAWQNLRSQLLYLIIGYRLLVALFHQCCPGESKIFVLFILGNVFSVLLHFFRGILGSYTWIDGIAKTYVCLAF